MTTIRQLNKPNYLKDGLSGTITDSDLPTSFDKLDAILLHNFHVRHGIYEYIAKTLLKGELRILRQRRYIALITISVSII